MLFTPFTPLNQIGALKTWVLNSDSAHILSVTLSTLTSLHPRVAPAPSLPTPKPLPPGTGMKNKQESRHEKHLEL